MSGGAGAFASTADPAAYLPYEGAERRLAELEVWVGEREPRVCVLCGPEGAGKSMLLGVLAARVGRHAVPVAVSAGGLDPEALARTLLDALGVPWEGSPRVALARAVERAGDRRLLLLIDDADALVPRTEMWLFDLVRRAGGMVRALLAVRDPRLAAELAAAFQTGTPVLALDVPMSRGEAEAWVQAELARGNVDTGGRARFDPLAVARLHARSGGVPGRLREAAAELLASVAAVSPAPASGRPAAAEASPASPAGAPVAPRVARQAVPPPAALPVALAPSSRAAPPAAPLVAPAAASPPKGLVPPPAAPPLPRSALAPAGRGAGSPVAARSRGGPGALPAPARSRDSLARWWLVPAALAVAYVGGFLTSQGIEALRATTPDAAEQSVPAIQPPAVGPPTASPSVVGAAVAPAPTREAETEASGAAARRAAESLVASPAPAPLAASPAAGLPAVEPEASPEADLPAVSAAPPAAPLRPVAPPRAVAEPPADAAGPPAAPEPSRRAAPPAPRTVAVSVAAEAGAAVLVDGRLVGSGAVTGLRLPPGPHRVEVRLADGRVVERTVEVKGTRYEVRVR